MTLLTLAAQALHCIACLCYTYTVASYSKAFVSRSARLLGLATLAALAGDATRRSLGKLTRGDAELPPVSTWLSLRRPVGVAVWECGLVTDAGFALPLPCVERLAWLIC